MRVRGCKLRRTWLELWFWLSAMVCHGYLLEYRAANSDGCLEMSTLAMIIGVGMGVKLKLTAFTRLAATGD